MARRTADASGEQIQKAFWELDARWDEWAERGLEIRSLTVRPPKHEGLDWTLVIRASVEGQKCVAFLDADHPERLFIKLVGNIQAGTLKWREDQYAD